MIFYLHWYEDVYSGDVIIMKRSSNTVNTIIQLSKNIFIKCLNNVRLHVVKDLKVASCVRPHRHQCLQIIWDHKHCLVNTDVCFQYSDMSASLVDRTLTNPSTRLPFVVLITPRTYRPFERRARRQRGDDTWRSVRNRRPMVCASHYYLNNAFITRISS